MAQCLAAPVWFSDIAIGVLGRWAVTPGRSGSAIHGLWFRPRGCPGLSVRVGFSSPVLLNVWSLSEMTADGLENGLKLIVVTLLHVRVCAGHLDYAARFG